MDAEESFASGSRISPQMTPTGGRWWAAYDTGDRQFVVPVVCFDEHGMPYVWSSETHAPVSAVRTSFIAILSDAYRGEYGETIATAIKRANSGHRGEASAETSRAANPSDGDELKAKLRDGAQKARDAAHHEAPR